MWLYRLSSVYADKFLTATANYNYFHRKKSLEADISMIMVFLWILWKTAGGWVRAVEEEGEDRAQDHSESVPCQGNLGGLSWSYRGRRQPASQSAGTGEPVGMGASPGSSQDVPLLACGYYFIGRFIGHHCGCNSHGAVEKQAQTFFLLCVTGWKDFFGLMQSAA